MPESSTATASTDDASGAEPWTALAAWAADELAVRLEFDGKRFQIVDAGLQEPSDAPSSESTIRRSWFRRRSKAEQGSPDEPDPFSADTPAEVVEELVRRLNEAPAPAHARPVEQPTAVHELSARLFEAYTLDGGLAHLAGCHFEDVPLVRLTWLADGEDDSPRVEHRFFDELGVPLAWRDAESLGIDRVAPLIDPNLRVEAGRLDRMLASAERAAAQRGPDRPALTTLVWAKRAKGRLRFEFNDDSLDPALDVAFDGWARTLTAPAAVCPATGVETFHLAVTDDGQIAAADAIQASAVTGRRALVSELVACSATGKLAEAEHLTACAATGEPVLHSELVACGRCGLRVTPSMNRASGCEACRSAERVTLGAAVWEKIVDAHPRLAKGKWQATQTTGAYVLESSGWLRRSVVTLDRLSLDLLHAAEAGRFSSVWRPIALSTYQ